MTIRDLTEPTILPVTPTPLERLDLPLGETRCVDASSADLERLSREGWRVVGTYVGSGVIHSRHVERPDCADRPSYDRTVSVDTIGAVRFLVLQRDEGTAIGAMSKRLERAEKEAMDKNTAMVIAKREADAATKKAQTLQETNAKLVARIRAMLPAQLTMERDVAVLRDYVGKARTEELLGDLDPVHVPTLDEDGEEEVPF